MSRATTSAGWRSLFLSHPKSSGGSNQEDTNQLRFPELVEGADGTAHSDRLGANGNVGLTVLHLSS